MNIIERSFQETLGEKYLSYALSTIMSRSLPDVRDGLKPVHRRLLFAMRELKLNPTSGFKKCARVVGDVIGKFHPHGDVAVYDALVRLAQDFSLRYPLIEGQGNFGNIDGDNAAAMRYTEARLTDIAMLLFEGLDENAIDFKDTYDGESNEPKVLPAGFPNLLANGASGIAVGMATNIPPHNILEICDALLAIINKPEIELSHILEHFKGPDFPTGGQLYINKKILNDIYTEGKGTFRIRSSFTTENLERGKYQIIITEIPYGTPKSRLLEKLGQLIEAKKLPLINDIRDESTEDIRIIIEPKSSTVDANLIMEFLYKNTELETRFSVNMNVLDHNLRPVVMKLKDLLNAYLVHRLQVLDRRTRYRLKKIEERLNLVSGFLIVYLNLDEVIRIIREEDEPKSVLIRTFALNDLQAEAILNMRLRSLRKLEEMELRKEFDELTAEHAQKQELIDDPKLQNKAIKKEIESLRKYFEKDSRSKRRSIIHHEMEDIQVNLTDFIEKEPITIVCSEKGWIKTVKGHLTDTSDIKYKEGDQESYILHAESTDKLILFTSLGKSYTLPCDKLPGGRGVGEPLRLMVEMDAKEDVISFFIYPQDETQQFIVAASDGRGFRLEATQLLSQTRNGKQILNVTDNISATKCTQITGNSIGVVGENRKLIVFAVNEVPIMNRGRGVMFQKYLQGGMADLKVFNLEDGLTWKSGNGTRKETNLERWNVKRGQSGRLAPTGFPRNNKFN
ncbi:MAG: DNA topoisomerase IV subunit A [Candidatus Paracaedibacteraceae bacterium]|nr:DNA topoisomerase IV subunit A [Candidatus Paracaedibacteraceae bacterium]